MLIAHVSDLHIGAGRKFYDDLLSEKPFYLARHEKMLDEMLQAFKIHRVDRIFLTGDQLDHNRPTTKEYELLSWFLHSAADIAPTSVIPGNHEHLYSSTTVLHPCRSLTRREHRLHWFLDLEFINLANLGLVLFVPWYQTAEIADLLTDSDKPPDYIVAHYAAKGCVYENGYSATKGFDLNYYEGKIKNWFLGDIHARQKVASNAWYSGSPCQLNFGEGGSKGFDLYDSEQNTRKQILLSKAEPLLTVVCKDKVPEFMPGALYRAYVIRELLDYPFPPNVVNIQLLETKTKGEQAIDNSTVATEVDFGDPLTGLTEVLDRSNLPDRLVVRAVEVARNMAQKTI